MQASQQNSNQDSYDEKVALISSPKTSSFSPFVANTLQVQGFFGFFQNSACYSSRHNMIIACPENCTVQFYDATTLKPLPHREAQKLEGCVIQISFHPETDSYIMGCNDGSIYLYNASSHELKKLKKFEEPAHVVTFVNSRFYAFSVVGSQKLFIGNIENEDVTSFDFHNEKVDSQQHLTKRKLLVTGLETGSLMIHRTDRLPHLRLLCSRQAHQGVTNIEKAKMSGKEYIITGSYGSMKIWDLKKGRMRLLKVFSTGIPYSIVYLEKYKMIATAEEDAIKFFRLLSGKLENTVSFIDGDADNLFLMKEKNMIGATNESHCVIKLIKLEGAQKGGS